MEEEEDEVEDQYNIWEERYEYTTALIVQEDDTDKL